MADGTEPLLVVRPTAKNIAQRLVTRDKRFKEIATLVLNGKTYTDWTSVRVETRVSQPYPIFQFECSEETPMPVQWAALQFAPGDAVQVYLGGVLAVVGYIRERHVAYDATKHAVRLMGTGDAADLVESVVPLEVVEQDHSNKNWAQLTRDISAHLGIKLDLHGNVDLKPFQSVGIQPGETIMNVVERHAKMRNIVIGSNFDGGLLGIGEHVDTVLGSLEEGIHILRANAVMRDTHLFEKEWAIDGSPGGSKGSGGAAERSLRAVRPGSSTRPREMGVVTELSDGEHGVNRRADMEMVFTEGSEIEANITVQGWFKENNQSEALWRANESYVVDSPSLMMNKYRLGCSACVYEQNDGGTTTTLTMVNPIHLNKAIDIRKANLERVLQKREEQLDRRTGGPRGRQEGPGV